MITVLETVKKFVMNYGKCTFQDEESSVTLTIKQGNLVCTLGRKRHDNPIIVIIDEDCDTSLQPEIDEVIVRVYTMINPNYQRYQLII